MKPVFQSTFGAPGGDCFSAALASILEVPLADVPRFCDQPDEDWTPRINDWLHTHRFGLYYVEIPWSEYLASILGSGGGVYVLTGRSPRGDFNHSVVAANTDMIHDPHPSGVGIQRHTEDNPWIVGLLIPFDPTKVRT